MPTQNDFLPFANSSGANVLTQSAYQALTTLLANGFSAGLAQSAQVNKVLRQPSIFAAVLAQLIVNNTGQPVVDDGTTATILANLQAAISGRLINVQTFTASGVYTPSPGTASVIVEMVGGGGSSGGVAACPSGSSAASSGGSAGAYARARFTSGFSGATVTVGAGGTVGAAGANGNIGGTSSFGSLVSAPGGPGGLSGVALSVASISARYSTQSSAPVGANIVGIPGPAGEHGIVITPQSSSAIGVVFGKGGCSPFGFGSMTGTTPGSIGYGAGAAGVSAVSTGITTTPIAGAAGGPGLILVYEYA